MTIPSTPRRSTVYVGNGAATQYPFHFTTADAATIAVTTADADDLNPASLVNGVDFTVALNADQESAPGGVVSYAGLAVGHRLVITSTTPYSQTLSISNQGAFHAKVLESALDRIVTQVQQLAEIVSRAATLPATSEVDPTQYLQSILDTLDDATTTAVAGVEAAAEVAENARDAAQASATAAAASESGVQEDADAADAARIAAQASQTAAATSEANALAYRNTASTHATTATTKASEASTSAANALAYRNTASTHATTATTQAGVATTKANEAAASAAAAATFNPSSYVARADVLGPVAAPVGGEVAGAIIETGDTGSGVRWTKYADGTLIASMAKTVTVTIAPGTSLVLPDFGVTFVGPHSRQYTGVFHSGVGGGGDPIFGLVFGAGLAGASSATASLLNTGLKPAESHPGFTTGPHIANSYTLAGTAIGRWA